MNSDLNKQAHALEVIFSRKTKSYHPQTCFNNESAKLRGLCGLVGGVGDVGQKFAWPTCVVWVYKILAWVKKMAWVA